MKSREFYTGCKNTIPYPHLPLIFAYAGKDIKGMLCEDELLQGIVVPSASALKLKQFLLTGTHLRAVYWLQMADEAYERSKKIAQEIQKQKLDLKTSYSFSGIPLCTSPLTENKVCLPFSQKFMESAGKKKELGPLGFADINTLGNLYNSKKTFSQSELLAINAWPMKWKGIAVQRTILNMMFRD